MRSMVDIGHDKLTLSRQCELLGLPRSSFYYKPAQASPEDLRLMKQIDEIYTRWPSWGSRKIKEQLKRDGEEINRKRVQRYMRLMGIQGIAPGPNNSKPHPEHKVYPYLLRGVKIERVNQVWSTDITYIPMAVGFMYLVAVIDWHSRYVLSWRLSNTLEADFCVEALEAALECGTSHPEIFNTDQGSQFTSEDFTGVLEAKGLEKNNFTFFDYCLGCSE